MLRVILTVAALVIRQASSADRCACELKNGEAAFPHEELTTVEESASKCLQEVTQAKSQQLESLLLGLDRRLPQLLQDVAALESGDDGELYGVVSLQLIHNELQDVAQLVDKLNATTRGHLDLADTTEEQLDVLRAEMTQMEKFDVSQVVQKQQANQRLRRDLDQCRSDQHLVAPPTPDPRASCPHGRFANVSGARVFTPGEYPGSYKYGAWGRDPLPEQGQENWYWMVPLTSSNRFSNYVRMYHSLSSLIVGLSQPGNFLIHTSNPTTNTVQGPNVVLYNGSLYYNCYNKEALCRFHLKSKIVTSSELPKGSRVNSKGNYCHVDECYPFTDLDLATDESGVWLIYTTTQDFGNLVLSRVDPGDRPTLGQTWHTSVYKQAVTNAFVACGVLYATRFVSKETEEIFYALDTATGAERFDVGVPVNKMSPNIFSLNYSPVDQMLHAYSDAFMVSYKVLFD